MEKMKGILETGFDKDEGSSSLWDFHQYVSGDLFVFIDNLLTMDDLSWNKSEKQLAEIQEVIYLYIDLFLKWAS